MASTSIGQTSPPENWQSKISVAAARLRADVIFALVDSVLIVTAYSAALILRFIDLQGVPPNWWRDFALMLPLIVSIHLIANFIFGAYGHVWEFASVEEAMRLASAAAVASIMLAVGTMIYREVAGGTGPVPMMVLAVGAMLTLGGMGAVRFRSRLFSFRRASNVGVPPRTLIIGTDQTAVDLARRGNRGANPIGVVGFLSTHPRPPSVRLAGLPVLGTIDALRVEMTRLGVDQVVVAASVGDEIVRRVVDECIDIDVRLRLLPDMQELMSSNGGIRDVRDLEIEDLLPRPTVSTDMNSVRDLIRGRVVLVTGAGGSIGAEVVSQTLGFEPHSVVCVDHDETHLHDARLRWATESTRPVLADIRERAQVMKVFEEFRPDVVFHAAAHKHVPILESAPEEAVKTNVLGTMHLLEAAQLHQSTRFILVSTDKAVAPASVMGASKRVAEMLVQASAVRSSGVFASVRFGNVLGSRGSVVPTFAYQIRMGGPVTISDPEMTRYFMTTHEAVQLVLQSSAIASSGDVLVLDMGEPVKIVDLARRMIRLAGLVPGRDIEIEISGMRPGEKICEELSVEPLIPSGSPKISLATPEWPTLGSLLDGVFELENLVATGDRSAIRESLFALAGGGCAFSATSPRLFEYEDVPTYQYRS